jgi:hypothetical protein
LIPLAETLQTQLSQYFAFQAYTVKPLAGDGSDRSYYRITNADKKTHVLMVLQGPDRESLREGNYDWLRIAKILGSENIRIPDIYRTFSQDGAILHEDLGDLTLEAFIATLKTPDEIKKTYDSAVDLWSKMIQIQSPGPWQNRSFNRDKYLFELFFLKAHLLQPENLLKKQEFVILEKEFEKLSSKIGSSTGVFTHRDFHSRNLMVKDAEVIMIDFQDAMMGPASYDLVSLCFDPYVPLPSAQRLEIFSRGLQAGSVNELDWPLVLLQRLLKAIGSFGYLTLSKKKGNYLKYVSPTIASLKELSDHFSAYPFIQKELLYRLEERYS